MPSRDRERVRLSSIGDVPAEGRVRHFDELDAGSQAFVVSHVAGDPDPAPVADLSLDAGDVVVYTDYLAVRSA